MPPIPIVLAANHILLFTNNGAGRGRETNDENNDIRETILKNLLTPVVNAFLEDPTHGTAWRRIQALWRQALVDLAVRCEINDYNNISVIKRGGRKYNWDIDAVYGFADGSNKIVKVEFKFGGTSVANLPEFFNPAADKDFHSVLYAGFFYDNYMDELLDIYGLRASDKPARDVYLKYIHKNTPSAACPFFKKLRDAEDAETMAGRPKYKQKTALAHKSIQAYLAQYKDTTKLKTITEEFQRSQKDKHFLIYSDGAFHHDCIYDDELVMQSVVGVEGDYLVIQSARPTTKHRMLLRWKNHQCVLFPAWQISMVRST